MQPAQKPHNQKFKDVDTEGQLFGAMTEKAANYLLAGVSCVWVVDPTAQTITVFPPDAQPKTYQGKRAIA